MPVIGGPHNALQILMHLYSFSSEVGKYWYLSSVDMKAEAEGPKEVCLMLQRSLQQNRIEL